MEIKIKQTKTTIGFGNEEICYEPKLLTNAQELELFKILGVKSWNEIPSDIRKNGREDTGQLYNAIEFTKDFFDEDDWKAVQACIKEAKNRSKTIVTEVTRIIE